MPYALLGVLAEIDPTPSGRPEPLEDWEVTPGLAGFVATFAIAVAAVVLFLSLSRHMRKANAYARAHDIPVPQRRTIGFRRDGADGGTPVDGGAPEGVSPDGVSSPDGSAGAGGATGAGTDATPDAGPRPPA